MNYLTRLVAFIMAIVLFIFTPITARANSLSYIAPEEVDGIPEEIKEIAEIVGNEFNICPELLEAIAYYESRYTADATNGSCRGLMQINTNVHQERFINMGWSAKEWDDPYKNTYVAADYLAELFTEYEDVAYVLYLYNGDTTNAKRYKQNGYLSAYVSRILTKSEELERLHGK